MATAATIALMATPLAAEPLRHEIVFVDHIEAGLIEQDVFVDRNGEVYRATPDNIDMSADVFTTANPVPHDPGNTEATGPFAKGVPLNMTMGDWLSAAGTGTYVCEDGHGHLQLEFSGLVPDGVYTLWHFFMTAAPTEPFIGTFDLPIGALDGSQATFLADADGNAVFDQTFEDCIQLSGQQLTAGLAVNYHSDDKTYGVLPGDFGHNAHIQLFAALPKEPSLTN